MKRLVFLVILINLLSANESLDDLILKFKNAPKEEKYIYMNRIKLELKKLSIKQREEKINEFKKIIAKRKKDLKVKSVIKSNEHKDNQFKKTQRKGMHGHKK